MGVEDAGPATSDSSGSRSWLWHVRLAVVTGMTWLAIYVLTPAWWLGWPSPARNTVEKLGSFVLATGLGVLPGLITLGIAIPLVARRESVAGTAFGSTVLGLSLVAHLLLLAIVTRDWSFVWLLALLVAVSFSLLRFWLLRRREQAPV